MKKLVEHVRLVENSMGSPWMGVRESKFILKIVGGFQVLTRNVIILTRGSKEEGWGHIIRGVRLQEYLKKKKKN